MTTIFRTVFLSPDFECHSFSGKSGRRVASRIPWRCDVCDSFSNSGCHRAERGRSMDFCERTWHISTCLLYYGPHHLMDTAGSAIRIYHKIHHCEMCGDSLSRLFRPSDMRTYKSGENIFPPPQLAKKRIRLFFDPLENIISRESAWLVLSNISRNCCRAVVRSYFKHECLQYIGCSHLGWWLHRFRYDQGKVECYESAHDLSECFVNWDDGQHQRAVGH